MRKSILCVFAAVGGGLSVNAADVNLVDEQECAVVGASVTNRIADKVTGPGSILKTGSGALALSNSANDFSGGIAISEGAVVAETEGALGSGAITVSSKSAGVHFSAAATAASGYATFSNPLSFTGSEDVGRDEPLSGTTAPDANYNAVFYRNTRLTGDIIGTRSFRLRHNPNSTDNPKRGGPSTIFDGILDSGEKDIRLNVYGTMAINGRVTAGRLWGGEAWSGGGTLALNNPQNAIGTFIMANNNLSCGAENVLGGAMVTYRMPGSGVTVGRSCIQMNGHDQTIAGISQVLFNNGNLNIGWNTSLVDYRIGNDDSTYCLTSSSAATLTITGGATSVTSYAPLKGAISLVVNSVDNPSFLQTFTHNRSTFTGTTEVRAGALAITGRARFSDTPSVMVAKGAYLICTSTNTLPAFESLKTLYVDGMFDASMAKTNPFSTLECLSLGPDASLSLPNDMILHVKSLIVNGEPHSARLNTPDNLPQLVRGTVIVDSAGVEAVWTGAESEALTEAGNWDGSLLDFTGGSVNATFARSGAAAIADEDATFGSVRFRAAEGEGGFAIGRSDPEHTLTVLDRISAETNDVDGTAHTYVIDTPLKVVEAVTLHADTNQILVVRDALHETSEDMGRHTLTVDGYGPNANLSGSVRFEGTNLFGGTLSVTTSLVRVTGLLANPDGIYTGAPSTNAADAAKDAITLRLGSADAGGNNQYGLYLDNATIGKSILVYNKIGCRSITTEAGTTNEVSGYLRYHQFSHQGVETKSKSELILSGGLYGSHSFRKYNTGTLRIRNTPVDCQMSAGFNPSGGLVVFEVPNNTFTYFILGYRDGATLRVETTVDNVLTNGSVQIGGYGGNAFNCAPMTNGSYTLDVHWTRQRCEKLAVLPRGTLTGEYPAMVEICDGWHDGDPDGYRYVTGNVTGGVGLLHGGAGTLTLTNRAYASCGDLAVTNGTLEIAANATWLNGTNVTVSGSGTLRLAKGGRFNGRNAVLWLGADDDDWQIDVPAGMSQTFAAAYDDAGRRISAGTYGNSASGAANQRYAAHFPNGGRINVRYVGTIVSIR